MIFFSFLHLLKLQTHTQSITQMCGRNNYAQVQELFYLISVRGEDRFRGNSKFGEKFKLSLHEIAAWASLSGQSRRRRSFCFGQILILCCPLFPRSLELPHAVWSRNTASARPTIPVNDNSFRESPQANARSSVTLNFVPDAQHRRQLLCGESANNNHISSSANSPFGVSQLCRQEPTKANSESEQDVPV